MDTPKSLAGRRRHWIIRKPGRDFWQVSVLGVSAALIGSALISSWPAMVARIVQQSWFPWAAFFTALVAAFAVAIALAQSVRHNREMAETTRKLQQARRILQRLSMTDPLTGLLNRRGLEMALKQEHNFIRRYGTEAYAMFIDLDNFKNINENYGHAAGDEVLRQVSSKIKSAIRPTDHAGRIGGDEFLVLFSHLQRKDAAQTAERIHEAVRELAVPAAGEKEIHATCSAGITGLEGRSSLRELISDAGRALKYSKTSGKDQIAWDGPKEL